MDIAKPKEQWKPVPGFAGRYEASDCGSVRSLEPQRHLPNVILLKPVIRRGYACVRLYKNSKQHFFAVHRLVLLAFRGPDPDPRRNQGNHIDGKKPNNRLENLEWATPKENVAHAIALGLKPPIGDWQRAQGTANGRSKLKPEDIPEIREMLTHLSPGMVAKLKGVSRGTIRAIDCGITWSHIP